MSPLQGPVAVVIDAEQPGFSHYGAGKGVYRCQYTVQCSTVQYSTEYSSSQYLYRCQYHPGFNHAVLLVGYGSTPGMGDWWKVSDILTDLDLDLSV